jgi:GSH-dependent disulfide-bond oxidoreductase
MIDLYALTSPNVQKIFLMLEECGLPYKQINVDVWKGEQFKPEFLKVNPNGKVPAIVDHDGPGGKPYPVFESGAILMYLADKTGKFLPTDARARFDALQWMMFQMCNVGPMFGQFVHYKMFAPPGNEYSTSRYGTQMMRLYDVMEKRLGEAPYLGGADYTIADIATFPWTRTRGNWGVNDADYPNLARWFKAISERPAVKKALDIVSKITSDRDKATDENKDRLFGRGKFARVA